MRVIDDGVEIALSGKGSDTMLIWSATMLLCAAVVAVICFTLPAPYAIGSVALWAVLMYFFNQKRHSAKTQKYHHQGTLIIKKRRLIVDGLAIQLSDGAQIGSDGKCLIVHDKGLSHYFMGFDDEGEIEIAKAVLSGQKIGKRAVAISINDNV